MSDLLDKGALAAALRNVTASDEPRAMIRDAIRAHIAALEKERDGMRSEAVGAIKAMIELLGIIGASSDEPAVDAARHMVAERDAALADNAAKDKAFAEYVTMYGVQHGDIPGTETICPEDDTCECAHILALNAAFGPSHPGAALLEEHRKEIAQWAENVEALRSERDTERRLRMEQAEEHRKALESAHSDGRRHALLQALDRLGMDSAAIYGDPEATDSRLSDELWNHVRWLEVRARNEGLERAE